MLRDPWDESGAAAPESENAHDPHEVTIQLDSVQFGASVLRQAKGGGPGGRPGSGPGGGQDASDAPVFVDESGRRSRTFRRIGIAVGISCAAYAGVIVVALLSGNSSAPWLPVPGQGDDKPAGQVDVSPTPRLSSNPAGVGSGVAPVPALSVPGGTTATPGVPAPLPSQSADSGRPSASADPGPSAGTSAQPSPSGTTKDPVPVSSPPVVQSPSPPPSSTDAGGSAAPSVTPGGGTGPVADGPADPAPVQSSPAGSASSAAPAEPAAPSSSSTENVL
ncbi:hypothetical protein [Streptomyces sp. NPDC001315]|uniref:hypothetical protein n=1 Tax=Streptomyces sp. NPDC001315 TaxID=3364562 RepID=UPI0036C00B9F